MITLFIPYKLLLVARITYVHKKKSECFIGINSRRGSFASKIDLETVEAGNMS